MPGSEAYGLDGMLLEYPPVDCSFVGKKLLWAKEQTYFPRRAFPGIRTVDEVAANFQAEVAPDRARRCFAGVCSAHRRPDALDCACPFENGGHDRAGGNVRHQALEKGLTNVLAVMAFR